MDRYRHSSWTRWKAVRVEVTIFRENTAFRETVHKPLHCYNMRPDRKHTNITSFNKKNIKKNLFKTQQTDKLRSIS